MDSTGASMMLLLLLPKLYVSATVVDSYFSVKLNAFCQGYGTVFQVL